MISDILSAAKKGELLVVEHILQHSAKDLNRKDKAGWHAIHIAAACGHLHIVAHLLDFRPSLLNKCTASSRSSPLYVACYKGQAAVVEYLLRRGATVDIQDSRGNTPLHAAMYWGHEDIAILLMENGAPVATRNDSGRTAQEAIVYNKERQLKRYREQPKVFSVGSKVEVNYGNLGNWFVGTIKFKGLSGVDVTYLDGEEGVNIPFELLRPHGPGAGGDGEGALGLRPAESVDNMLLYVGAKVQAQYHGEGPWFPGVISRVRVDGTFDIQYDDGDKDAGVAKRSVRLCNRGSTAALLSADEALAAEGVQSAVNGPAERTAVEDLLEVGARVRANFKEQGTWEEGTVTAVNVPLARYEVTYDDGKIEANVPLVLIDYLLVGTSVEGRYGGGDEWLPGVIMRLRPNGIYDIDYDNGEYESGVSRSNVRLFRSHS